MRKSYLVLHLAVLLAGFTGIFGKLITLSEGLLVWYRVLFSSLWLFIILKLVRLNTSISIGEKIKIARIGVVITIHWIFFYGSIKYANISIGVVCYSLTSFFTAIFDPLITRRKFSATEIGLSLVALLGIALIFHFDRSFQKGIILGVISSAFAALYTIYNVPLVKKYDIRLMNYYQMLGGTIVLGLMLPLYLHFFPSQMVIPSAADTGYLLLLSLFFTVGLYILFAEALRKIPAFTVNLSFNLEPIYAIIMAFLFFGEGREVNASFYVGSVFVIASIVLQTVINVRGKKRTAVQ